MLWHFIAIFTDYTEIDKNPSCFEMTEGNTITNLKFYEENLRLVIAVNDAVEQVMIEVIFSLYL